jgi:HEAT repeat protein
LNSANLSERTLPDSVEDLIQILRAPKDCDEPFLADTWRGQAASALGKLGDVVAVPALIEALKDPNYVCVCSALSLAKLKHPDAVAPLVAVLSDDDKFWVARGAAAVARPTRSVCVFSSACIAEGTEIPLSGTR